MQSGLAAARPLPAMSPATPRAVGHSDVDRPVARDVELRGATDAGPRCFDGHGADVGCIDRKLVCLGDAWRRPPAELALLVEQRSVRAAVEVVVANRGPDHRRITEAAGERAHVDLPGL